MMMMMMMMNLMMNFIHVSMYLADANANFIMPDVYTGEGQE